MGNVVMWVVAALVIVVVALSVGYVFLGQRPIRRALSSAKTQPESKAIDGRQVREPSIRNNDVAALQAEVREAERRLRTEERAYGRKISRADASLRQIRKKEQKVLASLRGKQGFVKLTPTEIKVAEGTFPVTSELTATADVAGNLTVNRRSTLTRMAAGGALLGPLGVVLGAAAQKTTYKDERQIYLLIEGEGFASLVICKPQQDKKALETAAQIVRAAAFSDQFKRTVGREVRDAQAQIAAAGADNEAVRDAREALEQSRLLLAQAKAGKRRDPPVNSDA